MTLHVVQRNRIDVIDHDSGSRSAVIESQSYATYVARFSPDDRWLAFTGTKSGGQSQIFIAPYPEGEPSREDEWIAVSNAADSSTAPWWSPDGNGVYYISTADGGNCIWTRRLDASTKLPVSEPEAVYHFHDRRLAPTGGEGFKMSIGGNRMVFNLVETKGNVWLARPVSAPV